MLSFLPIGAELTNFVFSRASRADNASVVADCDLHISSWEGADFDCGRKRASIDAHNDGKRSVHSVCEEREGNLGPWF